MQRKSIGRAAFAARVMEAPEASSRQHMNKHPVKFEFLCDHLRKHAWAATAEGSEVDELETMPDSTPNEMFQ